MIKYEFNNQLINLTTEESLSMFCINFNDTTITYNIKKPLFEIEGQVIGGSDFKLIRTDKESVLKNGGKEVKLFYRLQDSDIELCVYLRYFPSSPFIRFKYELTSSEPVKMTKYQGKDNICYTSFESKYELCELTEIQFSQFEAIGHSFQPHFQKISENELNESCCYPGPITTVENKDHCCLLAYEHGAEYPDSYLHFAAENSHNCTHVTLNAKKGNYFNGQVIDPSHPFISPWFHFAVNFGNMNSLLSYYREFFLTFICENLETRKPYIFYNTWNYQERVRYFTKESYVDVLNQDRVLKEIDIAHAMGVDVYVIDVPWFIKTGDWEVDLSRFPDGMKKIQEKLRAYDMKLGLWFNPIMAGITSNILNDHPEYIMTLDGIHEVVPIWDTEESSGMCLVSDYSNAFIQMLIRCYKEYGVTYFKWDAVGQYGCNSSLHHHGTEENTSEERHSCYSFKMGMEMIRVVEELTKECPDAIVDFDVTEGGRFVGLGFLSVGKYFLINNGPYAKDLDFPKEFKYYQDQPVDIDPYTNIYFYPGSARSKICRQGLKFDSFVPSILFLTHFLPDAPLYSQNNALASLMLGGNGIWGDLLSLSQEDIALFGKTLATYKQVARDITESYPIVKGFIGSSPEIHEKLSCEEASGLVCFFTRVKGTFTHTTGIVNLEHFSEIVGADHYRITENGRIEITVTLDADDARFVFILPKTET